MSRIEPASAKTARRRKLRTHMLLLGGALIVLSVGFGTWALVLGAALVAAPLGALLFREVADPEGACTFCRRERAAVNFLVAAPRALVPLGCVIVAD